MRARNIGFMLAIGSFVLGAAQTAGAATTFTMTNQAMTAWLINGANPNGALTLTRGQTYSFVVNATGHPFFVASAPGLPVQSLSDPGLSGNGTASGTVTFAPSASTPSTLAYQCGVHAAMTGTITVVNASAVPAVGIWPLAAFALLLASAGAVALRRRRRL